LKDNKEKLINKGKVNVIAIDGPAGSGKSTVAKLLARKLNLNYIDTGATYRAITLLAIKNDVDFEDEETILKLAGNATIEIDFSPEDEINYTKVFLNGEDVTDRIRSSDVGASVSIVSKLTKIREFLVGLQRKFAAKGPSVLEGRDIGSVVFPDAILKVFLTADNNERIKRRLLQEKQKGLISDINKIKNEIETRDRIDSTRKDSPLLIPDGAVVIDSTKLSIEQTFEMIRELYNERIQSKN